jgi:MoaD family protein
LNTHISYYGLFRSKIGKTEDDIDIEEGSTVLDLLRKLSTMYGKSLEKLISEESGSTLDPSLVITVNGSILDRSRDLNRKIKKGDKISLMSIVSGG